MSDDPLNNPNTRLDLASDLTGLAIDFPAPLNKAAATPRPTAARLNFKNAHTEHLSLTQPGLLDGQFKLNDQDIKAGAIHFGQGNYGKTQELKADELHLSGTLDNFNLDEWINALGTGASAESTFLPATLRISSKIGNCTPWAAGTTCRLKAYITQGWNIGWMPRVAGQIILPNQPTPEAPLEVKLSRLMFPERRRAPFKTPNAPFVPSPIDPRQPALHLSIGELSYGDIKLREIDLRAKPQAASASPKAKVHGLSAP